MKKYLLLLQSMILLVACNNHTMEVSNFVMVENLMQTHPDSALKVLESMPVPSSSNKKEYATYCLLLTGAQDKNDIVPTSDSLIQVAVRYFHEQEDVEKKTLALYYAGRVNRELNRQEEATGYFLSAAEAGKKTDNLKLQSLIYSNLGYVHLYFDLYDNALSAFHEAHTCAIALNDSSDIPYTYRDIGRVFGLLNKIDSAEYYYNRAIGVARKTGNERALANILNEISFIYKKNDDYIHAIESLHEAKSIREKSNHRDLSKVYMSLGEAYHSIQLTDSAEYYLNKALQTNSMYTKRDVYKYLYSLKRNQKEFDKALKYNDLYWSLTDSILPLERGKEVAEIQAKYDQEKLINENNQLLIAKSNLQIGYLVLGIIVLISITIIVITYQKMLLVKERKLQKIKELVRKSTLEIKENEIIIRKNEKNIVTIKKQLQDNADLKEQITEHLAEIDHINDINQKLKQQNLILRKQIQTHQTSLNDLKADTETYDKVVEQNVLLEEKNMLLINVLVSNWDVLTDIKEKKIKQINNTDWGNILEAIDLVYDEYTKRLYRLCPSLSQEDIQFCCLMKLRISATDIAELYNIMPSSVTKRKQRIKERLGLDKFTSLDAYLWDF